MDDSRYGNDYIISEIVFIIGLMKFSRHQNFTTLIFRDTLISRFLKNREIHKIQVSRKFVEDNNLVPRIRGQRTIYLEACVENSTWRTFLEGNF